MDPEAKAGRNIRRLRLSRALSQEALASQADIAPRHLGRIERGKTSATLNVLSRIAASLDCEIADLLADSDDPTPRNLPRGRHMGDEPAPYLVAREGDAAYEAGKSAPEANISGMGSEILQSILHSGISGPYSAAAERMIEAIVAGAGGEKRLPAAQRRRIEQARLWAQAMDIRHLPED
ncbi:helix-turn-helix domain-containing protein [Microbaculum marinum]|uniref:Helix-turn-helix domain-containing protein n=1 Tax=Microbaculum marinum TaxID=1764581 RepID=A0AAW9RQR6_9HYPH